ARAWPGPSTRGRPGPNPPVPDLDQDHPMSKFTIGIPTYNRAHFLRRSLKSACDQTWPDVEVLVSDNASTDETEEVVRSYGERVRYHRNPENIGMWPNFARLAEMAEGEYFSWLQDDDLIHCDFARRAVAA